jgi:hypothetical protein
MSDMKPSLSPSEVKEILAKNGIDSLDSLAEKISAGSSKDILNPEIAKKGDSWIIKVWKLSEVEFDMPEQLGGDIIQNKLAGG